MANARDVQKMFDGIARRYDLVNDVLSFRLARYWRKKAAQLLGIKKDALVLDLCCGTGDFAFALARNLDAESKIIGLDFSWPMLERAQAKQNSYTQQGALVHFIQGDAESIPFVNEYFDLISSCFGVRNVEHLEKCLYEMRRVLKPNGLVAILEFGRPRLVIFRTLYRFYSRFIMPLIGAWLSGDKKAFHYLPQTAATFPDDEAFAAILNKAGLHLLRIDKFLSGLAYLYLAKAE